VINRKLVVIAALAGAMACNSDSANQASAASTGSGSGARDSAGKQAPGGGPGRGGGRAAAAITLAASDVGHVRHDVIEAGIPITGDLRPIETIGVRARIEGDLTEVLVREGERVTTGQLLARFESSEQETTQASAEADVSAAKSDLATAQWNVDQSRDLFKAGAISERDLKITEQTLESTRARLAAANARLKATSNIQRDTRVLAPATGIIDKRLVQTGERVTRGQQLFSLVRNDALELTASVPARQASAVVTGQAVHFVADTKSFDGRVSRVSPTIDPTTRSITVYIQVPNRDGSLKGGTFASGRVVQRTISNALVVPTQAIRQSTENGQTFVYKIANRQIDIAMVTLGVIDERAGKAEVMSGLSDGDRVIIGNVGVLGRGMQVTVLGNEDQPGRRGGGRAGRGAKGAGQQAANK
jgi:membrane fusion protein (multidrug efflux system)